MKRFSPTHHPVEFHRDWAITVDSTSGDITLSGKISTIRPYTCLACKGTVKIGNSTIPVTFSSSRLQGVTAHTFVVTCTGKCAPLDSCPAHAQIHLEFTISDGSHRHLERLVEIHESMHS